MRVPLDENHQYNDTLTDLDDYSGSTLYVTKQVGKRLD